MLWGVWGESVASYNTLVLVSLCCIRVYYGKNEIRSGNKAHVWVVKLGANIDKGIY